MSTGQDLWSSKGDDSNAIMLPEKKGKKWKGMKQVANFPFPTPRDAIALAEAESCLKALEALHNNGRLTPLGKAMAHYPMNPRHSRMLLTVIQIMRKAFRLCSGQSGSRICSCSNSRTELTKPFCHGTKEDAEQAWRVSFNKHPLLMNEEELLGQAICAGWADRVAKRTRTISRSSEDDRKVRAAR